MSRSIFAPLFACTVLFLAVSLPAQAQEDLVRPEGWQVRFDNPEASEDESGNVRFHAARMARDLRPGGDLLGAGHGSVRRIPH